MVHCHDAFCGDFTILGADPLGTVAKGQWVRLLVQWDQDLHQFTFQRGTATPVITPYAVSDTAPPGIEFKALRVDNFVANCTSASRRVGFADALFDNVFVNQSAAP